LLESLIPFRHGLRGKTGTPLNRKPTIGLALGGGAARGFAHIGILRTLLANGIVPDIVVGTSIGAVVGGSYAAGHLDTLEAWARGLLPRNIFSYLDIRLSGSGLIGGSKLAAQLEASFGNILIDELPLKFAAVSTEVNTGHEIWLTDGKLVEAVRASYALPGIFEPVLIGDRWLVDGALVNPVPVSVARALGAEIVIACNVSTDVFGHRRARTRTAHRARAGEARPREILLGGKDSEARILRQRRTSRNLDRDGRSLQHHAGPHHPLAPRGRSAGRPDLAAGRQDRLVRFPSRRGNHRSRRPRGRAQHRVDSGSDQPALAHR